MSVAHTPGSPELPLSPCIRHCTLDDENVCVGCGRHIDEIVGWSKLGAEQQRAVVERSAQRLESRKSSGKNSFER